MPLYASVALIREGDKIYPHLCVLIAPTEEEAIKKAKIDLGQRHGDKQIMGASISQIDPAAIREAMAELISQDTEQQS